MKPKKKVYPSIIFSIPNVLLLTFGAMLMEDLQYLMVEQKAVASRFLKRYVIIDCYLPKNIADPATLSLLILNDGQSLDEMPLAPLLDGLLASAQITPLLCVGIHCNKDRREEYGTAHVLDYEGRGTKSAAHQQFIVEELIPFVHAEYGIESFAQKTIAGFSLGGLSAIDTMWNYPDVFTIAGVFSGSLWWRTKALTDAYNDATDKIMHRQIREGVYQPGLRFYFTTGSLDETADRNGNGIIDSIDDTLDLIKELEQLGYNGRTDIRYVNYEDGRHDIPTWGRAIPAFLLWAFSKVNTAQKDNKFFNEEVME